MHRYLIVFFLFLSFTHFAQLTEKYTSNYVEYEKALDLFKKEQYSASRNSFRKYIDNITDKNDPSYTKSLYYEAMAALELQQNDAVQLTQNFVKNYPENNYKGQLFTKLGLYFFSKKDYNRALLYTDSMLQLSGVDKGMHSLTLFAKTMFLRGDIFFGMAR